MRTDERNDDMPSTDEVLRTLREAEATVRGGGSVSREDLTMMAVEAAAELRQQRQTLQARIDEINDEIADIAAAHRDVRVAAVQAEQSAH